MKVLIWVEVNNERMLIPLGNACNDKDFRNKDNEVYFSEKYYDMIIRELNLPENLNKTEKRIITEEDITYMEIVFEDKKTGKREEYIKEGNYFDENKWVLK